MNVSEGKLVSRRSGLLGQKREANTGMDTPNDTAEQRLVAAFLVTQPPSFLVSHVRALGEGTISHRSQEFFLLKCLKDEVFLRYPSSKAYVRSILKNIILAAEQDGEEVLDSLYEMHSSFVQSTEQLAERCYKSYTFMIPEGGKTNLTCTLGDEGLSELISRRLVTLQVSLNMLEGDTGCALWPAGLFLSEFLLTHPEVVLGKSCLELGSGTGMCGIWLSRLHPSKVVLTDGSLAALANLRHNLAINGVQGFIEDKPTLTQGTGNNLVHCQQLLWETVSEEELNAFNAQVIFGADLIYNPMDVPNLIRVLAGLLRRKSIFKHGGSKHLRGSDSSLFMEAPPSKHPKDSDRKSKLMDQRELAADVVPDDLNDEENGDPGPVAYIATEIRNLTTLDTYFSFAFQAGLEVVDVTQSMLPLKYLPELYGYNRTQIRIHMFFFPM